MANIEHRKALFTQLDAFGISHTTHTHEPIFTVEEGAHIKASLPGGHTKNLFLKDKGGALFLICALGETKIALNQLHKHLACKRLSFGKAELLLETLGVPAGSVCLFAIKNDTDGKVQLIIDKALYSHDLVNFHPLDNAATTAIAASDIEVFAKATGHEIVIVDFTAL